MKPDKDRERDTESFGSTGGILVGIGEHVVQFAQLSGLGGFESFSPGGPFYIMTCPTLLEMKMASSCFLLEG